MTTCRECGKPSRSAWCSKCNQMFMDAEPGIGASARPGFVEWVNYAPPVELRIEGLPGEPVDCCVCGLQAERYDGRTWHYRIDGEDWQVCEPCGARCSRSK